MKPIILLIDEKEILDYHNRRIEKTFYETEYNENLSDEDMEIILTQWFSDVKDVDLFGEFVTFKSKGITKYLKIENALKIGTKYFKLEEYADIESVEEYD